MNWVQGAIEVSSSEQRSTADELGAELAASLEPEEATVVGMLKDLYDVRSAINDLKKTEERMSQLVKFYLERHPEPLTDGEHGITARLQERSAGARPCDLFAVYENAPELFKQLVVNGCLRVDEPAVKRAGALTGGIERYMGPKPITRALLVEKR